MYRILLAVDGKEERLARQLDAIFDLPIEDLAVTLLYVHEEVDAPPDEAGRRVIESINEKIDDLQGVPAALAEGQKQLAEAGIQTETLTHKGDPAPKILETAENIGANAICIAGRDRTPVGKAVFGSVIQDVVRGSERPTIVV